MPSKRRKSKNSRDGRRGDFRGDNHLEADSTDEMTANQPHSEPLSAPQDVDSPPSGCTENGSFQDGNAHSDTDHIVCGQNDQTMYIENAEGCEEDQQDSEPSPVSLSEDSGFTSRSESDLSSQNEIVTSDAKHTSASALRAVGIELNVDSSSNTAFPKRPGFGRLGSEIKLISNCYPISFPEGYIYHYDVEVVRLRRNPETAEVESNAEKYRCLKTKEKRRVMELMNTRDAIFDGLYYAYDGEKNLLTRKPISASFPHVFTTNSDDEIWAQVIIQPVKKENTTSCAISLDVLKSYFDRPSNTNMPLEAIAALEIILRHGPCLRSIPIGRSFFTPPGPGCLNPLAGGLEIWYGYHQSVRICQWQPTVNLDISATTFYPGGPLLQYIAAFLDTTVDALRDIPFLADRDRKRLNRKLKDRKIKTTHVPIKYTIVKLMEKNAHNLRVDIDGPTVARYFKERYGIHLEYPNLPCLLLKPEDKRRYLPIELCNMISGQHYNDKLTEAQKSEMIKFTSCPPKQRFEEINNNLNFTEDRCVQGFGLEVSEDPLLVEGRTLDPPSLIYRSDKKIRPRDASWNMIGAQFLNGAEIESWALLAYRSIKRRTLEEFGKILTEMGRNLGVNINKPDIPCFIDWHDDIKKLLKRMKEKEKVKMVVVVIPDNNQDLYKEVKKSAETVLGLVTQCILEKNVIKVTNPRSKGVAQLITNLFQKINVKMEGINYTLVLSEIPSILWVPVIIMGADVNHPGAYRGLRESVAACSGSLDARCSKYAVRTISQINENSNKKSVEIILDLKSMVMDLLRAFYRHTKKKPEKIIFYRDGVSEGEFSKVRNQEVASIRKACTDINGEYKPGITFIVVQKRHHVRFMTKVTKQNVLPGTVVDTGVTHPENFDFFLCSQKSWKGTAKPAHYTVLADDNGFTADDLQKLTNQLCYCNVRCTKSISIPAPVAYAHLAAYRARKYLDAGREGSSSDSTDSMSHRSVNTTEVIDCTTVVEEMRNSMYFV